MASLVAARRTDSSYPKFLAGTNPSDLIVQPNGGSGSCQDAVSYLAQIAALPHVQRAETATSVLAATITPRGGIGTVLQSQVQLISSTDGMFSDQDRATITAGRAVDPAHPGRGRGQHRGCRPAAPARRVARPGRSLVGRPAEAHPVLPEARPDRGRDWRYLTPRSCRTTSTPAGPASCSARPALAREFQSCCANDVYVGLRLTGGERDDTAVAQEYGQLEKTSPSTPAEGVSSCKSCRCTTPPDIEAEAQQAIRPEAIALGVFGVIAGLAALLIGVQSISRQLQAGSGDTEVLRGLGASPAATTADGLPGILGAIAAGSLLAVAVAVGLSPLTLFGPVRAAEPSAGIYLDTAVLGTWRAFPVHRAGRGGRRHRLPAGAAPRGRPRAAGGPRVGRGPGRAGRRECRCQWWQVRGSPWSRDAAGPRCRCARSSPGRCWPSAWSWPRSPSAPASDTLVSHPALYGWNFNYALYSTDGWGPFPPQVTRLLDHDRSVQASYRRVLPDGPDRQPATDGPGHPLPGPPGSGPPDPARPRARRARPDRARPGHAGPAAQAGRRRMSWSSWAASSAVPT